MAEGTPGGVRVRRCRHGHMMFLSGDTYVGGCLERYGEFSEAEVALFRQLLHPGDVVVEAGSNIGALTLPLARLVGPEGRVFAYEPQRLLFHLLCGNLALNEIENVSAIHAAVGRRDSGPLHVPVLHHQDAANFGGMALTGEAGAATEPVAVQAIDQLELSSLRLLKVDVEGAECDVLDGAAGTIFRHRPALYVENDRRHNSPRLISIIQAMGYRAWWHLPPLVEVDNFHRNPDNVFGNIRSINLLCLPIEVGVSIDLREVAGPDDWWQ
ncbi:MAG: FkbM family methyltransferase [Actinomycetota bacterium]